MSVVIPKFADDIDDTDNTVDKYDTESDDILVSNSSMVYKKKNKEDTIIKEFQELPFTDDIKNEAYEIYKKMEYSIRRKNNRKYLKFFCIYNAHINLSKPKDSNQLGKIFGLETNRFHEIFKIFSFEKTGYKMKQIILSPLDYITEYYKITDLRMDEIDGVINFANDILNSDDLSEEYPQVVAAGIIIYYMKKIHGIIPSQKFINYIGRSDNMINKIVKKIGSIYNK